ncbi:MAG: hypothetical protein JOZ75_09815 [Candidatus Dormibacteraeota bacterium]|nr:hypothetical protein [Candidatus Dormibacteraeota bacterium]
MKLLVATVCDAATVREGLLHILGAGVNRFGVSQFPAQLAATFAFQLEFERSELGAEHELAVELADKSDGRIIGGINMRVRPGQGDPSWDPELPVYGPSALPLSMFVIERAGLYEIAITFEGKRLAAIPLTVKEGIVSGATPKSVVVGVPEARAVSTSGGDPAT